MRRKTYVTRCISAIMTVLVTVSSFSPDIYAADTSDELITPDEEPVSESDSQLDHVADEVVCYAASREEAESIAARYGYLKDYAYCVATIALTDMSVEEAVQESGGLLEPNSIWSLEDTEIISDQDGVAADNSVLPAMDTWQTMYWDNGYNDPALNPENDDFQWMHDEVNSYAAWGVTLGSSDVTVAILDTGVYSAHEDLEHVTSYDIGHGAQNGSPHATHVAGIVAATLGNHKGGAGIAPGVNILSINVFYNSKHYNNESLAKAIYYVAGYNDNGEKVSERHADIINMSLGGFGPSELVQNALNAAYASGICVVVSMGNDSANVRKWPAGADHTIAVCATDETGSKTGFSTYGAWADISAPGHNIYSSAYDKNKPAADTYTSMSGTSMAAPIVAGACALYMSKYGHIDPDIMEQIIKKSVHKAASPLIGTGIIDLAVMFGGEVSNPEITSDNTAVNITAEEGSAIVYTTDGKAPSVKNGDIACGELYTGEIPIDTLRKQISKRSKIQVKAIAVSPMGVVSKPALLTLELDPYAGDGKLEGITLTGPDYVIPGSSSKYKVLKTVPALTDKINFIWSVTDESGNEVSWAAVNSTGALSVAKTAPAGTQLVISASADDAVGTMNVTVMDKVSAVNINTDEDDSIYRIVRKKGSVASLRLFTANIDDKKDLDEHTIRLTATGLSSSGTDTGAQAVWTTSDARVVDILADGNTVQLKATGKGKATVKCTAQNKTTAISVQVHVPVSDVYVTSADTDFWLSYGGKMTLKAAAGRTYGIPTNSKVTWDYEFAGLLEGYDTTDQFVSKEIEMPEQNAYVRKNKLVKLSNGKLSVAKEEKFTGLLQSLNYNDIIAEYGVEWPYITPCIIIRAKSTDGTDKTGEFRVYLNCPTCSVELYPYECTEYEDLYNGRKVTLTDYNVDYEHPVSSIRASELNSYILYCGTMYYNSYSRKYFKTLPYEPMVDFSVVSSNPEIASGAFLWSEFNEDYDELAYSIPILVVNPKKKGNVTFTISACDGSGFKRKVKVNVP